MDNSQQVLPKRILTIAGSEAGGTAGLQADLKTIQELGGYGMSVITAIVGQHPKTKQNVHTIAVEAIEAQFFAANKRTGVDAVKTGMLFSKEIICEVSELLSEQNYTHLVVDPVMVGKLGKLDANLLKDEAVEAMKSHLLPQAELITPNMPEASILLDGMPIHTVDDMKVAAVALHQLGPKQILLKGGRLGDFATDVLYDGTDFWLFETPRVDTENTSGAGDTISAAITTFLARGFTMVESVQKAKAFVTTAIANSFSYNEKVGPVFQYANRLRPAIDVKITKA